MKKIEQKIFTILEESKNITMSKEERLTNWDIVSSRTFATSKLSLIESPVVSKFYRKDWLPFTRRQASMFVTKKHAFGILITTLVLTGCVSSYAEDSLPGDTLYSFKVGVTEKIFSAIAYTSDQKAKRESIFANRRLEEIEKLYLNGTLTDEMAQKINDDYNLHVGAFRKDLINMIADKQYEEVIARGTAFQTRAAVHATILSRLAVIERNSNKKKSPELADAATLDALQKNILFATIPTVISTRDAVAKNSSSTEVVKIDTDKIIIDVDMKQVETYLPKLNDRTGVELSIENVPSTITVWLPKLNP